MKVMSQSSLRNLRRVRRGSEVLEAALVFPLLLALAFGTVEFGYFFYLEHNLQAAAREGARRGIVQGATDNDIADAVDEIMLKSGFASGSYQVAPSRDATYVTVDVQVAWSSVSTGLRPMRMISPANDLLRGTATMRIEN